MSASLKKRLEKAINRINVTKHYMEILHSLYITRRIWRSGTDATANKIVVLDFVAVNLFNYYFAIVKAFSECGYIVIVRENFGFLGNSGRFGGLLKEIPNVYLSGGSPCRAATLTITDNISKFQRLSKNVVLLRSDLVSAFFSQRSSNSNWMSGLRILPFPMSPDASLEATSENLRTLRKLTKDSRVFFSGNSDSKHYNSDFLKTVFKVKTRLEVLDELKFFTSECPNAPGKIEVKLELWVRNKPFTKDVPGRTPDSEWLRRLASNEFFIAPPGVLIPFCHNVIEAMSVGSIPILEYGYLFSPPLTDLVNCIYFGQTRSIADALYIAASLDEEQRNAMRHSTIQYYDWYLSSRALVQQLESSACGGENEVFIFNTPDAEKAEKARRLGQHDLGLTPVN